MSVPKKAPIALIISSLINRWNPIIPHQTMRKKMQNYSKSCDVINFFLCKKYGIWCRKYLYSISIYLFWMYMYIQGDSTLVIYVYFVPNVHQYFKEKCNIILNQFIIIFFSNIHGIGSLLYFHVENIYG